LFTKTECLIQEPSDKLSVCKMQICNLTNPDGNLLNILDRFSSLNQNFSDAKVGDRTCEMFELCTTGLINNMSYMS